MINMTVFTIIYNDYGQFLDKWLKCLKEQTLQPKEIIVVLGRNHGVDIGYYDDFYPHVKFLLFDSDVMGTLRNVAITNKRFKKCLYFSVDDELLPNAIQAIDKKFIQGYKVVGLKFNDLQFLGTRTTMEGVTTPIYVGSMRESYILDGVKNPKNWRKANVPGYIAVNGTYEYEDIEIPNYPYIFKLRSLNLPMAQTDEVVANYIRRPGSHGDINVNTYRTHFVDEIERWCNKWQYTGI